MMRRVIFILLAILMVAVQLTFTACDTAQSRAKKIVSLRSERKQMLDNLYQEYGGSELSQSINSNLQKEKSSGNSSDNQIVQGLANLAQGADRSVFEQSIRTVGSGENLVTLTDKAKQFFSRGDVVKKAKKICEIDLELGELENKGK
jgi:hypothetical protein